jgi:hypothetical protein
MLSSEIVVALFFRMLYLVPAWNVPAPFLWQSNRDAFSVTIFDGTVNLWPCDRECRKWAPPKLEKLYAATIQIACR